MTYTPTSWTGGTSGTEITSARLTNIENGVVTANTIRIVTTTSTFVADFAAAPAGSYIFVPAGTYANPSGLGNGATLAADNITVEFAPGAEIQVSTWGQPGIDCVGRSGITIIGGLVRYTGTRGNHLSNSGRASALYNNGCGVFFNKDRCTVRGLRTINMAVGVFFSGWATSTATDYRGTGNRVYDIEVEGADWGVVWTAQDDFILDGLYFHDDIDDSSGTNPTHAVYCTSTDTFRSRGVVISNLIAKNVLYGQPYQIKYADNIQIVNAISRNSRGLANVIGCVDLSLTDATATGCLVNLASPAGVITVQGSGASRHRYKNIAIEVDQTSGYDQRVVLVDAADSFIDGLTVASKRTSDSSTAIVQVRGLRNTVRNVSISDSSGINPPAIFIGGSSVDSSDTHVDGLRISGCKRAVDFYGPATGTVRYLRSMVSLSTTTYTSIASGTPDFSVYEDGVLTVSGTPEGAVTATVGKVAVRRDATAGNALYVKESGTGNTGWRAMPKPIDVQVYTSNATWTKPAGAMTVEVIAIGGGAGGGSGRRGAAGTVRCGGGGGGGGGMTRLVLPAAAAPSSASVVIGAGGGGGAAVTADDTNGNSGTAGGTTSFGSLIRAAGGASGGGGTNAAGAGGAGGVAGVTGSLGGSASATGGVGTGSQVSGGPSSGASGGGITSANVASNGAQGLGAASVVLSTGAGGVVDTTAPGAAAAGDTGTPVPGAAGGGGAASITTAAQAGAAAGLFGAGGSGGGASLNGNNSGAGGAGSAGVVAVITYF